MTDAAPGTGATVEAAPAVRSVCVFGLWHLGTVAAACLAESGLEVRGVDLDPDVIRDLKAGRPPIFEPGLEALIDRQLAAGRLLFTASPREALPGADAVLIAYDTPVDGDDRSDLTPILAAVDEIGRWADPGALVVVSSQVPVGTCEALEARLRERTGAAGLGVAYCPENLNLGRAIDTFLSPDRLVIGADTHAAAARTRSLFAGVRAPALVMSRRSAEMTKHALNSFLATSVSFVNEIADLCDVTGADVVDVVRGLKSDSRIGPRAFLAPGLGFAGGTLARDIQVLRAQGEARGMATLLLDATLAVNRSRVALVERRLAREYGDLADVEVAILGLTYKPGTSTLRRSIALDIGQRLAAAGCPVRGFDPMVRPGAPEVPFRACADAYAAADGADALVIATEWPEFRDLDFVRIHAAMRRPLVIDCKNHLDPESLAALGFHYAGTGRPVRKPGATAERGC